MWIAFFIILTSVIAIFVIVVNSLPSDFRIARSAIIAAPPPAVFAHINDFHKWEAWSPWAKLDPAMKQTYEGEGSGPGAIYTWAGNRKAGEGRMTILESRPAELIRIKLEFLKPFPSVCTAEFTLKPAGNKTEVTWTLAGKHAFVPKAFGLLMNMDKMVGKDFEKGLAQLRTVAEKG